MARKRKNPEARRIRKLLRERKKESTAERKDATVQMPALGLSSTTKT